ncbi:MAG: EAL domain-containing protein [Pseudomonadota bacterium]
MDLAPRFTPTPQPEDDAFALARRLQTPVWVYDVDQSRVVLANESACRMWGAEDEAGLVARDMGKDMSTSVARRAQQHRAALESPGARINEVWTFYPKGEPLRVRMSMTGYPLNNDRTGILCEAVGYFEDVPTNVRSAEALTHTDVMILLFSVMGEPLYMNPAARNAFSNDERPLSAAFINPEDWTRAQFEVDLTGEHRFVARLRTVEGVRWHDISIKFCHDAVTGNPAYLITAFDVSELRNARDRARYLADRDQLTGCYNRAHLMRSIASLPEVTRDRCTLVYLDIDRFKEVNDRYGHEFGDAILKEVASRARAAVRPSDTVARLGGDEFVLLMQDLGATPDTTQEIDRIFNALCKPITYKSNSIDVTVSMGVTVFTPGTGELTEILREADIGLYKAKTDGRNRWAYYNAELGAAAAARLSLEAELKHAMADRQFVLHFQPRIDLKTGRIVSAEALIRWKHPEKGLIAPGKFIPVTEETGMIVGLGRWVLEEGCRQAIAWDKAGLDISISLNVSPGQFEDPSLMDDLAALSALPGFPRGKIELEITEGVLIGRDIEIERRLEEIVDMGFRVAIDDFGTGYSNLSYISRFPLHCLKMDMSFISQLPESGPIVRLILSLASQLNTLVVAEGVETSDQHDWLKNQGCDQAQGYLYQRPVPLDEFLSIIKKSPTVEPP